jgi:hypothetical protein
VSTGSLASSGNGRAIRAGVLGVLGSSLLLGVLALLAVVAGLSAAGLIGGEQPAITTPGTNPSALARREIPAPFLRLYERAAQHYGLDWAVLAAIGRVECDHGRDADPSCSREGAVNGAGAGGPMQFLASTWAQYGVDGDGDGRADRWDPADAIFGAANYLAHSGAPSDYEQAIFAYNHAGWYVDSVMLRAKLIGGMPASLVGSLTGLADGLFPVDAAASYADDGPTAAGLRSATSPAKPATSTASAKETKIYAKAGSPVVAVNDGVITGLGHSPKLGGYVRLRDAYGNTYTYSHLKTLAGLYAAPKLTVDPAPVAGGGVQRAAAPRSPASAGHQTGVQPGGSRAASASSAGADVVATDTAAGPQRLFAHPNRAASFAAGGREQVASSRQTDPSRYLTQTDDLDPSQLGLKPLVRGSHVLAGAVLGWIGSANPDEKPYLEFQIKPAGAGSPQIDPKPILDGWQLLDATSGSRSAGTNALFGSAEENSRKAQILVETKAQLEQQVLGDPSIAIYADGRRRIAAGQVDQQVLATLEFLSASGLRPTVSGLQGAGESTGSPATSGSEVDISAINGIPVLGHQGVGSITDIAIRQLLALPSSLQPLEIISLMSYPGNQNAVATPDHADRISLVFPSAPDLAQSVGQLGDTVLTPPQWLDLITRLGQISNPVVAPGPSSAAVPDQTGG